MKIVRFQDRADEINYGLHQEDDTVALLHGNPYANIEVGPIVGNIQDIDLCSPVTPSKIIAVGLNYKLHAEEVGMALPEFPMFFYKPPTSVIGPKETIILPETSDHVEHECELAVVMGERCSKVSVDTALKYIFGYTCGNDISARDWQKRETQWVRGKGFDTFLPLGPCIQTNLDPTQVQLSTRVNGEVKQSSSTSDLIFPVDQLISELSAIMTLLPGDIIVTGTPSGVGPIHHGDLVEVEVEGIGTLQNPVASA
mgnify:CR=1 FL=1|tara:strand:+ start:3530 stop:4294 length:765 start_codon:yes stop_codon:yes gene_type:complete